MRHAWETAFAQIWMKLRVLKDKLGEVLLLIDKLYRDFILLMNEQGGHSLGLAELTTTRKTKQLDSLVNSQICSFGIGSRIH